MKRSSALHIACGALISAAIAFAVLPIGFITGAGGLWPRPRHDLNAYLTTWEYFIRDDWRFPLLSLPAMGYPEGGNILFADGLPLAQLASKLIYSLTDCAINPFGWWIYLTYVAQGAFAVRVVRAAGARSWLAAASAAVLATACTFFVGRLWHVAISSHFLILWALALYLENVRERRFGVGEHFALIALTLLINPYLFIMVGALQAVTFLTLVTDGALVRRDWIHAVILVLGTVAVGYVEGYGELFSGASSLGASGFGVFSWNPLSMVVPPEPYWGPHGLVRDATLGQAEGESYLGVGNLLVVLTFVLTCPGRLAAALRRHWVFVVALVLCTCFAISNRVYVGSTLLVDVPLPPALLDMASLFRASGRFIWVPAYALVLLSLAGVWRWLPAKIAIPIVLLAVGLQLVEVRGQIARLRPALEAPSIELVDEARVRSWMSGHRRLFQFPSWSCGGLWSGKPEDRVDNTFREMQTNLLAARMGLATNTVYTSRAIKDCALEAQWPTHAGLDNYVLYFINPIAVDRTPSLTALARSSACVDAGWAIVCSRKSLAP